MSNLSFTHDLHACRVALTENGAATASEELTAMSVRRPMVVGSRRAMESRAGRHLLQALAGSNPVVFDEVSEHPELAGVERGRHLAAEHKIDGFVSLGGGSAVDLTKGVAVATAMGGSLERFALNRVGASPPLQLPADLTVLPILAMPNTASGAEVTPSIGLRDASGHKLILRHAAAASRVIVLDPLANLETPSKIMMPTGMNGIAHCLEALYSLKLDPISDALAIEGLLLLHRGLWRMLRDDGTKARAEILSGSFMAGRAIINARTGVHHATCHVLGAHGLSHGIANSIFLPHALRFNAQAAGALLDPAASALGLPTGAAAAEALATATDDMCIEAGLPRTLSAVGVKHEAIPRLAASVMAEPGLRFNPRQPVTLEDIAELLGAAI